MRRPAEWAGLVRGLGGALLELLGAELEALQGDFGRLGKKLAIIVALALAAVVLALWGLGVLTAAAVALFALWMPVWAAAGLVFVLLMLVVGGLAFVAWRRLEALQGPAQLVQGRWQEHLEWWHTVSRTEEVGAGPGEEDSDDG